MLEQEDINSTKYINFIQKEEDEAIMLFGELDSRFHKGSLRACKCIYKYYWSCEVVSLKIGGEEIYTSSSSQY